MSNFPIVFQLFVGARGVRGVNVAKKTSGFNPKTFVGLMAKSAQFLSQIGWRFKKYSIDSGIVTGRSQFPQEDPNFKMVTNKPYDMDLVEFSVNLRVPSSKLTRQGNGISSIPIGIHLQMVGFPLLC